MSHREFDEYAEKLLQNSTFGRDSISKDDIVGALSEKKRKLVAKLSTSTMRIRDHIFNKMVR